MSVVRPSSETLSPDVEKGKDEMVASGLRPPPSSTKIMSTSKVEQLTSSLAGGKEDIFVELDFEEDPRNMATWRKWLIIFVICTAACCGTCAGSMVSVRVI